MIDEKKINTLCDSIKKENGEYKNFPTELSEQDALLFIMGIASCIKKEDEKTD